MTTPETSTGRGSDRLVADRHPGPGKTPPSAAYFSQPVRQITLMLILSVLVAIGATFIFGRVLPVIVENPWLNGLIGLVFAIGVITCFWQVASLVVSVRWIEAFAAGRPGAEEIEAPRLLLPLAALLRSRGKRGGNISATSARSILDSVSARIEEARDITRYITNLLIFLGLLGTLYGLSTTVPAVVDTIRALTPKEGESSAQVFSQLMTGLESQLGGMGTAFSSSLLGLAGSLVVGLLELFASHGQNRFYGELEEWLSSFTRLSVDGTDGEGEGPRAVIGALAEHLEDQADFFRELRADLSQARARDAEGAAQLVQGLAALADRIEASSTRSETALSAMAEGQDRLTRAMAQAFEGLSHGTPGAPSTDAESRMRLRSIDTQMLRLLEEVAAGRQESMGELRTDLAQLIRAVRALGGEPGPRS